VIEEYDATGRCVAINTEAVASAIREHAGQGAEVALPSWQKSAADYISFFENETDSETIPSKIGQP
jgi:hypothetical protein